MVRNVRTKGHPSTHRREVRVARLDDNRRIVNVDHNSEQEINQMPNLAALTAYQNSLLKKLAEQKEQQLEQSAAVDSARQEKNLIPWIGLGIVILGGVFFLAFYFKKIKKLEKK